MTATETAVLRLAQCRAEKVKARAEWRRVASEVGPCNYYDRENLVPSCYVERESVEFKDWCPSCRARQAPWAAFRKAASASAGALRSVLALGRQLSALSVSPSSSSPAAGTGQ